MALRPYYDDGNGIVLFNGDCREVLPTLADRSVGLVATDPPYFRVKMECEWDRQWRTDTEFLAWLGGITDELRRVLAVNGSLYMFASPERATQVESEVVAPRLRVLNRIRWTKRDGWHKKAEQEALRSFLSPWEEIIFAEQYGTDSAASGEAGYVAKCDDLHRRVCSPIGARIREKREAAGLSMKDVAAHFPSRTGGITGCVWNWETGTNLITEDQFVTLCRLCGDRRDYEELRRDYEELRRPFSVSEDVPYTDVWDFPTVLAYPGKHPCEKPTSLLQHIVQASSRPGDTVLDCFAGTGSTLLAARLCGRRATGIEIDERYAAIAARRLEQGVLFSETAS